VHNTKKHSKEIHHFNPNNAKSALEILNEFEKTKVFGGGSLGKAFKILVQAKEEGAKVFFSFAGALIPGGMKEVINEGIKSGLFDCIVTTGANCTHDLIEAFGKPHLTEIDYKNDQELRDLGIDRVYDSFVSAEGFPTLEDNMKILIDEWWEEKNLDGVLHSTSHEFMGWIGDKIGDKHSFIKTARDHNVPIYVPVIADSVLGLQIWLRSQFKKIIIDEMRDLSSIQDLFHNSPKTCAFMAGGGVPKNYMLQSSLMSDKEYQYGVQITMDRVETGGLSGATLEEAVSWGKFTWEAPKSTVYADVTIILPLIVTAWKEYKLNKSI
jgi:deoxyhypusine synthase